MTRATESKSKGQKKRYTTIDAALTVGTIEHETTHGEQGPPTGFPNARIINGVIYGRGDRCPPPVFYGPNSSPAQVAEAKKIRLAAIDLAKLKGHTREVEAVGQQLIKLSFVILDVQSAAWNSYTPQPSESA